MILRKETFEQFGYDSEQLKSYSNKKVVIACDICGAVRITKKNTYSPLCRSCAQRGRKHSEKTKKKIGESQKGEKNHGYGKHLTEGHKRKLSEANKVWSNIKDYSSICPARFSSLEIQIISTGY